PLHAALPIGPDVVASGADDHHDPVGQGLGQPQGIADQGPTAHLVEHLRSSRAHPLTFARSQDHGGEVLHGRIHHSIGTTSAVPYASPRQAEHLALALLKFVTTYGE